jgi:hypothetical protein
LVHVDRSVSKRSLAQFKETPMTTWSHRRAVRRFTLTAVLALAGLLLAARPAPAQIYIAPDRSVVVIGPAQPVFFNQTLDITPIVLPGNQFVRANFSVSANFVNFSPASLPPPGFGFVMPFYASDRARAANFGGRGGFTVTGPFQRWWP